MAKYDHGGGCPCGLYSECNDGCHGYPNGMRADGTIAKKEPEMTVIVCPYLDRECRKPKCADGECHYTGSPFKEEIQVIKPHLMNDVCRAMENLRVQSKASDWGVAICKTCHREFNYVMRDREPVPLSCVRCKP